MNKLKTIDADTLMSTPLPTTNFVIERLLPEGLHILAGAAKVGKSWLALWLCLCVAKGEPVWDFQTTSGIVLYLCLEYSLTRIQNRLFQITGDAPDTLRFANLAGNIGEGLEGQIKTFLSEYPSTTLLVIDTLQKVCQAGDGANPYANDYRDLGVLKKLANEHRIAILLIHHLRKRNDNDPMNMISGTTGISGATDSNFVLKERKRGSGEATLDCTGRDIECQGLHLSFQKDTHTWVLTEPVEKSQSVIDPEMLLLSEFLVTLETFDGTATQLSALLEERANVKLQPSVLSKKLVRYAGEPEQSCIHFSASRTRDTRLLHILCNPGDGSDGNDGKNGTGPVADLPSQASQLSPPG